MRSYLLRKRRFWRSGRRFGRRGDLGEREFGETGFLAGSHGGGLIGRGDVGEHFLAEDRHVARGGNTDLHRVTIDARYADFDVVTDDDRFVYLAAENEHGGWR
jgi:hypothetical protein